MLVAFDGTAIPWFPLAPPLPFIPADYVSRDLSPYLNTCQSKVPEALWRHPESPGDVILVSWCVTGSRTLSGIFGIHFLHLAESSRSNERRVSPSPLPLHWSTVFKPTLTLEYLFFSHEFWLCGSWDILVDVPIISEARGRPKLRIIGVKADKHIGVIFWFLISFSPQRKRSSAIAMEFRRKAWLTNASIKLFVPVLLKMSSSVKVSIRPVIDIFQPHLAG